MRLDPYDAFQIFAYSAVGALFGTAYKMMTIYTDRRVQVQLPIQVEALYSDPVLVTHVNLLGELVGERHNIPYYRTIDILDALVFLYGKLQEETDTSKRSKEDLEVAVKFLSRLQRSLKRLQKAFCEDRKATAAGIVRFRNLAKKINSRAKEYTRIIVSLCSQIL